MKTDIVIAITAASYSGNKGAYAMLESSIIQLNEIYGSKLNINLMSTYPNSDREQLPFAFIRVVSCKPEQLVFFAFPLAILYKMFKWLPPVKILLLKNKILNAYSKTDLVIDEAGISFVDSRGFVMNTYAFITMAVPLLMGVKVVKYSQAMGTFKGFYNRLLAKFLLPKISLICARGEITKENLREIGIENNVKLCADGAFTMPDNYEVKQKVNLVCSKDSFYKNDKIVSLSISSVVEGKCEKLGIDYKTEMIKFIESLNKKGYPVLIIANAARLGSDKKRNNDLMICDAVYNGIKDKNMVRWYHEEMTAEEIREYISKTFVLVASRFHAMIGALEKKVPVLLIGWSHKYKEVLDMFELGEYAIDFSKLDHKHLMNTFDTLVEDRNSIIEKINNNYDNVMESSFDNIKYIKEVIDNLEYKKKQILDTHCTDKYIGNHQRCAMGYSNLEDVREICSSGGLVSTTLISLLEDGKIDGAWVTKSVIRNGKLDYTTFVAKTREDILSCGSSVYNKTPILASIKEIMKFDGHIAVVMLPCQLRALNNILNKNPEWDKKIKYKFSLYCSGQVNKEAILIPLRKRHIPLEGATKIIYKRGHWRGNSIVFYKDQTSKNFSYKKGVCAYKNAYFFTNKGCLGCKDHYGKESDMSFGDVWLKRMKKIPIKHTSTVIRTDKGEELWKTLINKNYITDSYLSDREVVMSQKRALIMKFNASLTKEQKKQLDYIGTKQKWNHKLAYRLAIADIKLSQEHPNVIEKIPSTFIYLYMLFIRTLLTI